MRQEELTGQSGNRKRPDDRGMIDVPFLALVLLLTAIGLIMMFSASYVRAIYEDNGPMHYFIRQAGVAVLGIGAMFLISRFNAAYVCLRSAKLVYIVTVILLIGVLLIGESAGGAKRWIKIAGQQFQPSEIAKFAVICMIAAMSTRYQEKMADWRYGVLRVGGMLLVILGLIALEKHLSAIMLIGLVSVVMMFVGGVRKRWIFAAFALAIIFFLLYVNLMGYAGDRITAWLHPEEHALDEGYQVIQSQYAIGSGGLFGLGFGMSRQKYLYLPFEYNDYIFAIVCEELGFVGALGIIILFALLVIRGYWIAMHAADRFSSMLAMGITTLLMVQVVLNIAVVCNLLPSTGVGLPFFSYGGTNLLMTFGEVGIILSISRWSSSTQK